MIFTQKPRNGLLVAVDTAFNCVALPSFSNVRIEDGRLTVQVEFKDRRFTREEMFEHLHDGDLRIRTNHNDFPYKFQGFEHRHTFESFRIKYSELRSWKENTEAAINAVLTIKVENNLRRYLSNTNVNQALLETLTTACQAVEYYKKHHAEEYAQARDNKKPMAEGWRFPQQA